MKENSNLHTGVLKTQDGRNLYLNPDTRLVELSKEGTSLIAINENGNLGIGGFNIELDFYIIQNKLYAEEQATDPEFGFKLECKIDTNANVHFYIRNQEHIFTELSNDVVHFIPVNKASKKLILKFTEIDQNEHGVFEAPHCCGVGNSSSESMSLFWEDKGHLILIDRALEYMKKNFGGVEGIWKNDEFRESLHKGLSDADYKNPYNDGGAHEGAWRSHFYDPYTKKNYRGETDRTAFTEGTKYYRRSLIPGLDTGSMGYNLGLALHYYTDLTQPCHASNFAEFYGRNYPNWKSLTKIHTFIEKIGDEIVSEVLPEPQDNVTVNEDISIEELYIQTATISREIFNDLLKKIPNLEGKYTYLHHIDFLRLRERKAGVRKSLLPYITSALEKGFEQTINFFLKWRNDCLKNNPITHYVKMWTANPHNYVETWIGSLTTDSKNYASFSEENLPSGPIILEVLFMNPQGTIIDPKTYRDDFYMIAVNHPKGAHVLEGRDSNGWYCYWSKFKDIEKVGYKLKSRPSRIIEGKWEILKSEDSGIIHKYKTYLGYDKSVDESSVTIEFAPVQSS